MKTTYLDFEQPVAELEEKIEQLRFMQSESAVDIAEEIDKLRQKCDKQIQEIYGKLTPWQIAMVARHPQRPYALDYASRVFTDFHELHGDRTFGEDEAIVGGLARLNGQSVMLVGHQKGRDSKERIRRNFGMPRPEGYRKALRLMKLAEKFEIPVITLIDTPGASAGIGAEERGQSEAIGRNLYEMAQLKVPITSVVIGEGGSGGALALGVSDQVAMLQYAVYSVISPEGCAAILWKSADKASEAAQTLGHHVDAIAFARPDRQGRRRADRRRPSRSGPDGRDSQTGPGRLGAPVDRHARAGIARPPPAAGDVVWALQGSGCLTSRRMRICSNGCDDSLPPPRMRHAARWFLPVRGAPIRPR